MEEIQQHADPILVDKLTILGFGRDHSARVLKKSNNDFQFALDILLSDVFADESTEIEDRKEPNKETSEEIREIEGDRMEKREKSERKRITIPLKNVLHTGISVEGKKTFCGMRKKIPG
eukprot:Lithocolla_globosa_v1_NODE_3337_length_1695_cov_10.600000.p1 type:complete len:119 gc:universal NODE_3337_length_1695_cov_10.600000:702-346(-)